MFARFKALAISICILSLPLFAQAHDTIPSSLHMSLVSDYIDGFGAVQVEANQDGTITLTRRECGTSEEAESGCDEEDPKTTLEIIRTTVTNHPWGPTGSELVLDKKPEYSISFLQWGTSAVFSRVIKQKDGSGTTKRSLHLRAHLISKSRK